MRARASSSISRPASIHVDDFVQRGAAGEAANPNPKGGAAGDGGGGSGAGPLAAPAAQQLQRQVLAAAGSSAGGPHLAQLLADPAVRMVRA